MVAEAWNEDAKDLDIKDGYVISYKTEESISIKDIVVYGLPQARTTRAGSAARWWGRARSCPPT